MLVVNFAAGPGAGKSTTAAGVFYFLKLAGVRAEIVDEYAKQLTYDGDFGDTGRLQDQLYVLAKQRRKLDRLAKGGKVQVTVCDSPLFMGKAYNPYNPRRWFDELSDNLFRDFENVTYFVKRTKPYAEYGRSQNEVEAWEKDDEIWAMCKDFATQVVDYPGLPLDIVRDVFIRKGWSFPEWMNGIKMPRDPARTSE
jgi:hypothetical protein